jgi:hypothetical protein
MTLSLSDVLGAPSDPNALRDHLVANGLVPAPAPAPVIPAIAAPVGPHPASPVAKTVDPGAASAAIGNLPGAAVEGGGVAPTAAPGIPELGFKDKMALPQTSAAVRPGSAAFYQNQLERQEEAKENPYGSAQNHPGVIGKIAHGLAKAGNIGLDIVAPATAVTIPGTELNKRAEEGRTEREFSQAAGREAATRIEAEKEHHDEAVEDANNLKLDQAQAKIDEEHRKNLSTEEINLRKQGLKPDKNNPGGPPIPISYNDMSPTEQGVYDLKQAQAGAAEAHAALEKIKADPNSPQSQAALERIRVMAQNAATAASKLGLDKDKFVAEYFGLGPDGNPLAGVRTDATGKPIGPKIAAGNQAALSQLNTHYVVPAEGVEKSYQMMDQAYKEYKDAAAKGQELPTGAQSMLALSTHLATTFGNVKGARITKDMVQHHLGARSISDDALVAIQKLTNGDTLSPAQWDAFHSLVGQSRKLSWEIAAKEAKRANLPVDFLPADLKGETGGAPAKDFGVAPSGMVEGRTGRLPDGTKIVVRGGRIVAQ